MDVDVCPECKVPEAFNQGQMWLNNGDIVQTVNPEVRMGFIECENLDPLFANVGDIIGMYIDDMVVNITARGTEKFMGELIPEAVKEMVEAKQMDLTAVIDPIMTFCHVIGFGRYEFLDSRYERDDDDYAIVRIESPFSVPEAAGAICGVTSALVGGEHAVSYEEVSPGSYRIHRRGRPSIRKRWWRDCRPYRTTTAMETSSWRSAPPVACPRRSPASGGIWIGASSSTGIRKRRMAMLGPELLDVVFTALEAELGEDIPKVVVEAQRRFAKTGFYSIDALSDEGDFRTQLALRGLGNLREMKMDSRGMHMRVDNAAGYLLTVGMVQGLFEMIFDVSSNVDWGVFGDGDLEVDVRPQWVMETV